MKLVLLVFTLWMAFQAVTAYDFYVSGFGATADDALHDAAQINAAIYAARFQNPAPTEVARIIFNTGTYLLNNTLSAYSNCKNIVFEGRGATLLFTVQQVGFYFDNCDNITIQNLNIDYAPLPFAGGKVIAYDATAKSIDVEIAAPHVAQARVAQAVITFDLDRARFGLLTTTNNTLKSIDIYQTSYTVVSQIVQSTPTQVQRVFFQNYVPGSSFVGQNVVIRYQVYQYNAINFRSCRNSTVKNTIVWTAPGMGLVATQSVDVTLDGYQVRRKEGRWMSTTADGSHFNNVRGLITIKNSYYEGMGDDAINIHNELGAVYWKNATTIGITKGTNRPSAIQPIYVGDVLKFSTPSNPFNPYVTLTVTAVSTVSPLVYCNLDGPITNINLNDVVLVDTIASAVIQNTVVRKSRARGILVNNKNTLIEDCSIEETTGPAILMSCDTSSWWEGNCARDVTVRNTRFYDNNFGVAQTAGTVQMLAQKDATTYAQPGVFRNIAYINNTFDGPTYRSFMHIGTADSVLIQGNLFNNANLLNSAETIFILCNSNNVTVQYNSLTADLQGLGLTYAAGSCSVPSTNLHYEKCFCDCA